MSEETVPPFGGCLWPLDSGCLDDSWIGLEGAVKERAHAFASATLTRLTGGRVSNCSRTVRPCTRNNRRLCFVPFDAGPMAAYSPGLTAAGTWVNACSCSGRHTCATDCEVPLPAPVGRIDEVKVNGAVIPPTDYRVDGNLLVWMGEGECPFPETQDLSRSDDLNDTFSVTYLNAYPVDSLGAYAVGILAMEFAKACTGKKCRLPAGTKSIVRQGVSMDIVSGAFPNGQTGIREVDDYIALWNPGHLSHAPKVWSPSMRTAR